MREELALRINLTEARVQVRKCLPAHDMICEEHVDCTLNVAITDYPLSITRSKISYNFPATRVEQ